jgi:hypothetical protein
MKKIYPLIFLFFIPSIVLAQWFGDGTTPATAYYGVVNASNPMQTWNTANYATGVIYIGRSAIGQNDLQIDDGGILTIQDGITIRFCTTLSDLKITGTGVLSASASYPGGITFTSNAQATWGHISFEAMTTTNPGNFPSVINNCLITKGDVSSTSLIPANPNQYGGAIHVDFSYVTISNCEIQSNKAGWGGGIFIGDGKSPSISNCLIHGNIATTSGGGIYSWRNSSPVISNSFVIRNNCSGLGGGGGMFIGGSARDLKVINCVISSNSANSQSLGHNVKIFSNSNNPKPKISALTKHNTATGLAQ